MISTESIRKQRKTLGILGGMGPAAGAEFYKRVVEHTEAHTDSEHIRTVLFGDCEIPDRTDYILGKKDLGYVYPWLQRKSHFDTQPEGKFFLLLVGVEVENCGLDMEPEYTNDR
ncbi:MAG: hypothetical protein MJ101_06745, partial [Clostridia bacterium]|nr:hypothetical protein [Clostridia bacterium]